jgi:hypothetical protein
VFRLAWRGFEEEIHVRPAPDGIVVPAITEIHVTYPADLPDSTA